MDMKATPLPAEPTMADIAASLSEMHECLDATATRSDASLAALTAIVSENRHENRNRAMATEKRLAGFDKRLKNIDGGLRESRGNFLTLSGQLRGLADEKVITDAARDSRLDRITESVVAVGERVGVGHKTPSLFTISPIKLALGITAVGSFLSALQWGVRLAPGFLKALGA